MAQPRGQCAFCSHETTKGAMRRHLEGCRRRQDHVSDTAQGELEKLYHLRFQDAYGGAFWFDAEVRGNATMQKIDDYLRAIWLECCGHMSKFSVGGWGTPDVSMQRNVGTVFAKADELTHIYDFGTESVTQIKALGTRLGAPPEPRYPVALMARNLAPEVTCIECAEQATHLCRECQMEWESVGTLCRQHAETHPHVEYGADADCELPATRTLRIHRAC